MLATWLIDHLIDRMHKWRPKKYSFVYVRIRLTSLALKQHFFCILYMPTRLVSLISTSTKEYFFGRHLCIRSMCGIYVGLPKGQFLYVITLDQHVIYRRTRVINVKSQLSRSPEPTTYHPQEDRKWIHSPS